MAALFPFRALRPAPAAAARVAAVPYDVVNSDEARALAHGNPLSFLHVSRAEIDLPPGTDPHTDIVYEKAAANFEALKAAAPLVVEDDATLYVYRLRMGAHQQTGVAGCFSLDEYDRDVIKKHERTRADKEDDRTRHMLAIGAQTGPVFLTYSGAPSIRDVVNRVATAAPLFDFAADDGIQHTIWKVPAPQRQPLVDGFKALEALYIADGHHRAASASRTRQQLARTKGAGEWDTFLAVAFPDDEVQILSYNRVVKDLGGLSPDALKARLHERFELMEGSATPAGRGEVAMFLAGRWYTLRLGEAPRDRSAADRLDVSLLQDRVLGPLLGIGDVRTDKRIDFVGGARGTGELEQLVKSGRAAVAFSMHPVSVSDLMSISDSGGIMPPKSTWFEPKLRDGLLSHVF